MNILTLCPVESGRELSWEQIRKSFSDQPLLTMGQAWRKAPQAGLRESRVRAGMSVGTGGEQLAVYAEMEDDDIFNLSRALNQRTWTLGDVFEIFLKSERVDEYYEFHVTPENQKLQLRFPSEDAFRARRPWGTHCLEGEFFFSKTLVEEGAWRVYAEVPFSLMPEAPWQYSFCRYDATRGQEDPIASSTSAYRREDFHCQADWGRMERGGG